MIQWTTMPCRFWSLVILTVVVLTLGCQSKVKEPAAAAPKASDRPPKQPPASRPVPAKTPPANRETAPSLRLQHASVQGLPVDDLHLDVTAPQVLLSEQHQATCRVGVGETFPDISGTSLNGEPRQLSHQMGERLTIVIFWDADQPNSVEQVRRMRHDFGERYQAAGVSMVLINVGDSPEQVSSTLGQFPEIDTTWLDPQQQSFAQVANSMLPRTYLLRPDRQIVWFDVEYSRSTHDALRHAIVFALRQFVQQASQSEPSRS